MIVCYFGVIGSGKTYSMVQDLLKQLNSGRVVYTNIHIEWNGVYQKPPLSERIETLFSRKLALAYEHPPTNLRPIPPSVVDSATLRDFMLELSDCIIALDEGWMYFDSYASMKNFDVSLRMKILCSRHDALDFWYTTQRPVAVQKTLRAMTNVFYLCTKSFNIFGRQIYLFEYDLNAQGEVDVDPEKILSRRVLRFTPERASMYDTTYWSTEKRKQRDLQQVKQDLPVSQHLSPYQPEPVNVHPVRKLQVVSLT